MKIVIDIPEELYKANNRGLDSDELWDLRIAINGGTILPKGHGRIIDESTITACEWNGLLKIMTTDAPTIIESDDESEVSE